MQSWFRANLIWHLQELSLFFLPTGKLILLPGFAKPALLLPSTGVITRNLLWGGLCGYTAPLCFFFCRSPGCSPLWHARIPSGEGPEVCLCLTGKALTFFPLLFSYVRDPWCVVLCSKASNCLLNNLIFLLGTFLFAEQTPFILMGKHVFMPHLPFLQCLGTADNWPWKPACHSKHLCFAVCAHWSRGWAGRGRGDNANIVKMNLSRRKCPNTLWAAVGAVRWNARAVNSTEQLENKCQRNIFAMCRSKNIRFEGRPPKRAGHIDLLKKTWCLMESAGLYFPGMV